MIKKNMYILCLLLISILLIGCDPKDEGSQGLENADEGKGTVIMTQGKSNDDNIIIDDGKSSDLGDDNLTELADDDSKDNQEQNMQMTGRKEGIFGNSAYTDDAVIEYYMGRESEGSDVTFTSMYGLHVKNSKILAIEDIVFADLVKPESMTKSERETMIQDVYNEMENKNLNYFEGLEIIDAYNSYGDETAIAFVYYVFDPEYAPLENYEQFLAYFEQKGFVALDGEASKDNSNNPSDNTADTVEYDEDGYCEDTLYGTPLYDENAIVTYYIKSEIQDDYQYSYIMGLQTIDGELVAIEDIRLIEFMNPNDYTLEKREGLMQDKEEELLALGHSRANGQEVIEAFHGHSDSEAIQFISYVFDPDHSGFADHEAYLIHLIESGFEYMQ